MKKLKVKWTPNPEQDIDAMTDPNSPFYDEEFDTYLKTKYGSIENYKKSEHFIKLMEDYEERNIL